MVSGLTKKEFELAKELTNIALANAATSFSKIMNDDVTFRKIELNPSNLKFSKNYISAKDHLFILITDFMGEVLADSFLIFNPANAQQTADAMFGKSCVEQMRDAALLELDNILAASVATKFSDILEKDIKGDVPQLERKNYIQAQNFVSEKINSPNTHFSFTTIFKSKKMGIEALFVCAFKDGFAETIKEIFEEKGSTKDFIQSQTKSTKRFIWI